MSGFETQQRRGGGYTGSRGKRDSGEANKPSAADSHPSNVVRTRTIGPRELKIGLRTRNASLLVFLHRRLDRSFPNFFHAMMALHAAHPPAGNFQFTQHLASYP